MIPQEAVDLILEFEGLDQPSKWPGGSSGITIGHGYDLGFYSSQEFTRDWSPHLDAEDLRALKSAIGKTGQKARAMAKDFRDIHIGADAARSVFEGATLPKWIVQTRLAFPGVALLPDLAFGALVSLTFNRGTSMEGDRRREMAAIRSGIEQWAMLSDQAREAGKRALLLTIAAQIRSMKRLWIGQGLDGLLRRREAEAALVEKAAASVG